MPYTRGKIAILHLLSYYTSLFAELKAETKCLGDNLKFCMCHPYGVYYLICFFKCTTKKKFFVDTKKEEKKAFDAKSKFLQFIQRTFIFTHIQN